MSATLIGANLTLVSSRVVKTRAGLSTVDIYEGTSDACQAAILSITSDQEYELDDSQTPLYRLTIKTPDYTDGRESYEWRWEVLGNDAQKDIYEHPQTLYWAGQAGGDTDIRTIREAMQNPIPDTSPAITNTQLTSLYNLLLRGTTHFLSAQYALRLTKTVGSRYLGEVSEDGVLRIYTSQQIIAEQAGWPMTARIQARALALQDTYPPYIVYSTPANPQGYTWGWLRKPTTETEVAGGKVQIQTEWWLELWSLYVYSPR